MAAHSEAEANSLLIYKSPAWKGGVLYSTGFTKEDAMTPSTKPVPVPAGFHTVTPALTVKDAEKAIGFYKHAFGAEERMRFLGPDEKSIMHAEIKIGDSIIMLGEEHPETGCIGPQSPGGTPVSLYLYVEDADQAFTRALSAGASTDMPVADMFWGDRFGQVTDPFGHKWNRRPAKRTLRLKKCENARASSLLKWLLKPDRDGSDGDQERKMRLWADSQPLLPWE